MKRMRDTVPPELTKVGIGPTVATPGDWEYPASLKGSKSGLTLNMLFQSKSQLSNRSFKGWLSNWPAIDSVEEVAC